jgi:hypothetical protein
MKAILISLVLLVGTKVSATHWLTYYVYYESTYIQGPWQDAELLDHSDYVYLMPVQFEDLFGSESEDFVRKIFERLAENKPEEYDFEYEVKVTDTSVWITSPEIEDYSETVRNELTTSLCKNGFRAVLFGETREVWNLEKVTAPFLEIPSKSELNQSLDKTQASPNQNDANGKEQSNSRNLIYIVLSLSVVLNLVLLYYLTRNKRIKH